MIVSPKFIKHGIHAILIAVRTVHIFLIFFENHITFNNPINVFFFKQEKYYINSNTLDTKFKTTY